MSKNKGKDKKGADSGQGYSSTQLEILKELSNSKSDRSWSNRSQLKNCKTKSLACTIAIN